MQGDKTRVYLERSKSSPISLSLDRRGYLSQNDPFFQIIPVIGQLKSLFTRGNHIQDIIARLIHPAPLLEELSICGGYGSGPRSDPVLTTALFGGGLSSLRSLHLRYISTELPWRNMVNLTSFTLARVPPGDVSVRQLLDFFESVPQLHEVDLLYATPIPGAQDGRLVSLSCLKQVGVTSRASNSVLLNQLLIPVGAKLASRVDISHSLIEDHFPKSLQNFRNFSDFTAIRLLAGQYISMEFSGPNGQVSVVSGLSQHDLPTLALESLAHFDTSKTEHLNIGYGKYQFSDLLSRVLLPMRGLRTLTLSCETPHSFIHALDPGTSSSGAVVCPNLEELVVENWRTPDIKSLIGVVAARELRGTKLGFVRITSRGVHEADELELRKHVLRVEFGQSR